MKRALVLIVVMTLAPAARVWAADSAAATRRQSELSEALSVFGAVIDALGRADAATDGALDDAPRRLAEGLRTGNVGAEDAALITRWILQEKEERVARGFIDALGSVELVGGGHDERWTPVAGAMVALVASALGDAEALRRRDTAGWPELNALVAAAVPAVASSLSEASPAAREQLARSLQALAPSMPEMLPAAIAALRHPQPEVRMAAAGLLGTMGASARGAVGGLRAALSDPDTRVREAAAAALAQIEGARPR